MSVRSRRTASVVISGSSNLPADKLSTLSVSINRLLQIIVDIYNACEDANTAQEDKFNRIADARTLEKDIDQLIFCLGEEMNICSESIRNTMRQSFTELVHKGKELKFLITQYSDSSSLKFQNAKTILEALLQLVTGAIDLLKMADLHFVERLTNEANVTLIYLKKVREAINMNDLVYATQDYTVASVNLAKRLAKRIDSGVVPYSHKHNAAQALEVLKNESANVVNVKRNQLSSPDNEMHAIALDTAVKTIVAAVKVVFDVARAEPTFGVDFQVDYVEDEFGLLLARLVDAVDNCDNVAHGDLLRQIVKTASNRSVDSGLPSNDPKIKKVKDDLVEIRDISLQCLQLREAHLSGSLITAASSNLDMAIKSLRESYRVLSDKQTADRTSLRNAAQKIIATLDKLIVI